MKEQTRRLQVGEQVYRYRVLHEHGPRDADGRVEGCRDILTLRRDAPRSAPLRLVFEAGPGRIIGDAYSAKGVLLRSEAGSRSGALNPHRPGVARAFLDEALAHGWEGISRAERDGWSFYDAVHAAAGGHD